MEFEQPSCTKDYSESDEEKHLKKDILSGRKKDKKDKKDKEKGYAALEGESSADENYEVRSPAKSKKTKSFKFASKAKDKREKSRDKEKESSEKRRDRDKRTEKRCDREKNKSDKKEIADELPIFGVSLELAVERSKCHDGIDLPLPFRACIDYLQMYGLGFEGIYKVNAPKSRIIHLKKLYNQRENIDLAEYDVPTVTGLLKLFLRELPEPIFTSGLLIRFEEAGAILNITMREKHLKILVGNLPAINYLILAWTIIHLYNVTLNEKFTKMNVQSLAAALNSTMQISQRLLVALISHCTALFKNVKLTPYIPPLTSTAQLPDKKKLMEEELRKQESLLSQVHSEMNAGFVSKEREELLWEVQRIITQLKRKIRNRNRELPEKTNSYESFKSNTENMDSEECHALKSNSSIEAVHMAENVVKCSMKHNNHEVNNDNNELIKSENINCHLNDIIKPSPENLVNSQEENSFLTLSECSKGNDSNDMKLENERDEMTCLFSLSYDKQIMLLTLKNDALLELQDRLMNEIEAEKKEIFHLQAKLEETRNADSSPTFIYSNNVSLDEIMDLLQNENQILQIKKISLVRKIMEQQELCIELNAKMNLLNTL